MVVSETAGLSILTRAESGDFATNVSLLLQGPTRVERLGTEAASVVVVTNRQSPAQMLLFDSNTVTPTEVTVSSLLAIISVVRCSTLLPRVPLSLQTVSLPVAGQIQPFITSLGQTFLAAAGVSDTSILYEISLVNPSSNDFNSKYVTTDTLSLQYLTAALPL